METWIYRYFTPTTLDRWSKKTKYYLWLQAELMWVEALTESSSIPDVEGKQLQGALRSINIDDLIQEAEQIENIVRHDVEAFLQAVEGQVKHHPARFLHFGLTSSDVVDSVLFKLSHDAMKDIVKYTSDLRKTLSALTREHASKVRTSRTHGQPAEKSFWGEFFSKVYVPQISLSRLPYAKISGPTGRSLELLPNMNTARKIFHSKWGSKEDKHSTQIIHRARLLEYLQTISIMVVSLEKFILDLRLHSILGEISEEFTQNQVGSSSMPQKRNPVGLENLSGVCRIIRSDINLVMEETAQIWLERDISNSVIERSVLPKVFGFTEYLLIRLRKILVNLHITDLRVPQDNDDVTCAHKYTNFLLAQGVFTTRTEAHSAVKSLTRDVIETGFGMREMARRKKFPLIDEAFKLKPKPVAVKELDV